MRSFEETRTVNCSVDEMFDIVLDIEAYPMFLPWVAGATLLTKESGELTAELIADLAGSRHSFQTIDRFVTNKLIEIRLLEGPFRFLESIWTFDAMDDGTCRVHFSIEFEFRSMMLDLVASPIFSTACKSMVSAFEKRAIELKPIAEGS
ncbi:type II toxin-antitoxin system RatA family toxin [Mariprofundus sp. EBB-1]|uniref:type II toxin-antitoxin system RatA family toxin n=1 Tax=Mariprofundus sp. EBB-1 TaxID=2650971 RepID=UPI000EF1DFDF|nr:type II toxin-antitoxin system RatA family toxin [Mariprofundus sp. EBB-1]RLL55924.1 type II toxin-antitoxin system RatA family toxin [Mariprofundus sp. EBB-1]